LHLGRSLLVGTATISRLSEAIATDGPGSSSGDRSVLGSG
jgi:hypothetical protein